jgi:uncharacterized membrane protein YesL
MRDYWTCANYTFTFSACTTCLLKVNTHVLCSMRTQTYIISTFCLFVCMQPEINELMRAILIDWLIDVVNQPHYDLPVETL